MLSYTSPVSYSINDFIWSLFGILKSQLCSSKKLIKQVSQLGLIAIIRNSLKRFKLMQFKYYKLGERLKCYWELLDAKGKIKKKLWMISQMPYFWECSDFRYNKKALNNHLKLSKYGITHSTEYWRIIRTRSSPLHVHPRWKKPLIFLVRG